MVEIWLSWKGLQLHMDAWYFGPSMISTNLMWRQYQIHDWLISVPVAYCVCFVHSWTMYNLRHGFLTWCVWTSCHFEGNKLCKIQLWEKVQKWQNTVTRLLIKSIFQPRNRSLYKSMQHSSYLKKNKAFFLHFLL